MQSQKMGSVWLFSIILINCPEKEELWSVWGAENIALAGKKWAPILQITTESKSRGMMGECWGSPGTNAPCQSLYFPQYQSTSDIFFTHFWSSVGGNEQEWKLPWGLSALFWNATHRSSCRSPINEVNKILFFKRKQAEPIIHQEFVCLRCKFRNDWLWEGEHIRYRLNSHA